ncbi:LCP family protein required for cell wall assembly [Nocardiopsis terrae]|uniref:LCP family protein required for cell wall assembly n=1 Tax=Nocardiopsis terrae TaxID=372655 RepID=A0ABR9HE83_9ACTN|nr:LCP family protein [Nocardiopsis terrae]MBE1457319.1 LCP family protein required for cell wall assembly [Nocardiopsis terrae]
MSTAVDAVRMTLGKWVACGMTGVVIAASLVAYTGYQDILGIETAEVDPDSWGDRPAQVEGLHNILLLGTDKRTEENASYSEANGIRPDVLILASIDADGGGVTMVNLPRDTMVDIPPCEAGEDSEGWSGGVDQLNHAMAYGGMDCQGKTVEAITDIHLDHIVMVDFAGFQNIVNTLGGIEMCVPKPIDDPKADLKLDAGEQTLNGEQALGLARSRASTENGSDLERIENQQRMMGAILREVTSGDVMSKPSTVYGFLEAVSDSLVTDSNFSTEKMGELAIAMREVDLSRMNMVTVPVVEYPPNDNKVQFNEPDAGEFFAAVSAGELTGDEEAEGESEEAEESVEPSEVSLRLLNNTTTNGLGAQVGPLLEAEGFVVTEIANPGVRTPDATTVYHGPDRAEHAELLASALDNAQVVEEPSLGEDLELVMGRTDWEGLADDEPLDAEDGEALLDEVGATSAAEEDEVSCG